MPYLHFVLLTNERFVSVSFKINVVSGKQFREYPSRTTKIIEHKIAIINQYQVSCLVVGVKWNFQKRNDTRHKSRGTV